jgi:hypothetical protein
MTTIQFETVCAIILSNHTCNALIMTPCSHLLKSLQKGQFGMSVTSDDTFQ